MLEEKGKYKFYEGYYGSCSGCDWLEDEKDWDTGEVDYLHALEFCQQHTMSYSVPKELWGTLTDEQKCLFADKDSFEYEEKAKEIIKIKANKTNENKKSESL